MWQCVAGGSGRCNECAYDAGSPCGSVSLVGVVVVMNGYDAGSPRDSVLLVGVVGVMSVHMMQVLHVAVCHW